MPRLRERGDQREAAFGSIRVVSVFSPRRSTGRVVNSTRSMRKGRRAPTTPTAAGDGVEPQTESVCLPLASPLAKGGVGTRRCHLPAFQAGGQGSRFEALHRPHTRDYG